jgi:hypothetical protein
LPTLHLHFDEAGNWDFVPKGTKHYVLAMAYTYDPLPLAQKLTALRFSMNKIDGHKLQAFHACDDSWPIKIQAYQCIAGEANWRFAAVVLEKAKVNPSLRPPERFYPRFAGTLLRFVLRQQYRPNRTQVLVYADSLPLNSRAKREGVLKAMKVTCAAELPPKTAHHTFSHAEESNAWIQVADYCCWAVYRKWEHGKDDAYKLIQPHLQAPELVITAKSSLLYY